MDNKKFEKLIDLIINEQEEQARELFHDIVVEKSREIYENIMSEEMMDGGMEENMGGQVGDLIDEINVEEAGSVVEADDELEADDDVADIDDMGDDVVSMDADELGAEDEEHEEIEDAVIRIEDKIDQLMADFEEAMGVGSEGEEDMGGEEDMAADEEDAEEEMGDEEMGGEEEVSQSADDDEEDDLEESVMENVELKKIPGLYDSKIGGDDGQNPKSIALREPKVKVAGVNPVQFSGDAESVPTSPKKPSNAYTKGEKEVEGAGKFKNAPGQNAGKTSFNTKAPAAGAKDGKEVGAGGSVSQNTKSVFENKKVVKK